MLEIELPHQRTHFSCGETISVISRWSLEKPPERVELRLVWNTVGKGDQDLSIVGQWAYPTTAFNGEETEEISLPEAPYSFSGKLISLVWAFELIVFPGDESFRREIVIAPHAEEIVLQTADADES